MYLLVQHTVRDYDAWKPAFDAHESKRAEYGCTCHTIYRDADSPNDVNIIMEYESRERAEAFMRDPSLREAMERGGVTSEPRATWLEKEESCSYAKSRAA